MKKWLLAVLLMFPQFLHGQANIAGLLYASNFAAWTVPQGNQGQMSWSSPSFCTVTSGGATFRAFTVGVPITLVDAEVPANTEVITPTQANYSGFGCSISAATTHPHNSFYFRTATAGLGEALAFAGSAPYQIVLTPDWTRLGGLTSTITSSTIGNANVTIMDQRTAPNLTPYSWSGSAYVAGTFGGGGTSLLSQKVVYVSKLTNIPASTAVIPGSSASSTTDSASIINAAISGGNVDLEVDGGYALSTSLVLSSNTTIHCVAPQYGFIMQAAANTPVLINAHTNAPTTTNSTSGYLVSNIGDTGITVRGCTLNANSTQAVTGTNNLGTPHSATPGGSPTAKYVGGVEFYAVNGLRLEGNECYDSGTWCIFGSNDEYVYIQNNYLHQPTPTVASKNTAGFQFDGPDQFIFANGNRINAGDDSIAYNADDGQTPGTGAPEATLIKSFVKWGNITDVQDSNEIFDSTYYGVRLLSTNDLMDRIYFSNISGTACGNTGTLYALWPSVGLGNLGTIRFDGWNLTTDGTCNTFSVPYNFNVSSNIKSLQISGLQLTNPGVNWPVLTQTAGAIGILSLRDWDLNTQVSGFSNVVSTTGGTIGEISASGISWYDNAANTSAFFSGSAVPSVLTVSNYSGPNRLLASGYSPGIQNGDAFTNTYATTYVNTTFSEAGSGNLAGTTPAVCTNGCTGTWTQATGTPSTPWHYSTASTTLNTACTGSPFDNSCPVYINAGHANFVARFTVTSIATGLTFAPVVRWTNANNFITVQWQNGASQWAIYDVVGGTNNLIATAALGAMTTGNYTLTVNGTSVSLLTPTGTISGTVSGSNTAGTFGFEDYASAWISGSDVITSLSVKSN